MVFSSTALAAKLLAVEMQEHGGVPSVLFTLNEGVSHKVFTLVNPNRVVIDFENTTLACDLKQVKNRAKGLINIIRSGNPNPHTLRVVFEVSQVVKPKANTLNSAKNNHGFSLDFSANAALSQPVRKTQPAMQKSQQPVVFVPSKGRPLRDVVVVIDPGHGGKDPGASGPRHTAEKQVTLAIATQLKKIIDKQPGMRAVLTRQGDYYIELRDRLKIARKHNGDVFVSIHADAFINQQSNGASVFALSQSGATSEAARWLAEKENYSELGGVNLSQLDDQSGLVRTVLIDLSQTATIGASMQMGERVLHHMEPITALHNNKVEQARFMVLKSPDIPSILIETGFISNPREERNLTNSAYQTRLTQAIFQGLKRYFWDNPPGGTHIEALSGNNRMHLVQQGEMLSKIALQYHVPLKVLAEANKLTDNQVRTGQKLVIPLA
jgi:N-acetylmuramoyl-L-alanine amidase